MTNNVCVSCKCFNACGDIDRVAACNGYSAGIAPLDEIERAIKGAHAVNDATKTSLENKNAEFSALFDERRAARINGDVDAAERLKVKIDAVIKDVKTLEDDKKRGDEIIAILNNNKIIAILNNAAPIIVEEFKKFSGKSYGEKTRTKIADAIRARCGCRAYIDTSSYSRGQINVYSDTLHYCPDLCIYTSINADTNRRDSFLTAENKINGGALDNIVISAYNAKNYVVNIDEYLKERENRRAAVDAAKKALEDAAANYNSFAVLSNDRAATYYNTEL